MSSINPMILIAGVAGGVLVFSGLKNKSVSSSIKALLAGQDPNTAVGNPSIVPVTDASGFNLVQSSSSGGLSQQAFYSSVLRGLGAPITQGALDGLAGVTQTEGVNNYNNPFNIEWHPGDNPAWKGIGNFNDVGVQKYASPADGVAATVAFLQGNSRWSNVVASLQAGNQGMVESALSTVYASWGAAFKRAGSNAGSLLTAPVGG